MILEHLTGTVQNIPVPHCEAIYEKLRAHKIMDDHMGFHGRFYQAVLDEVKTLSYSTVKDLPHNKEQLQILASWHEEQDRKFFEGGLPSKRFEGDGLPDQDTCFLLSTYHMEMWEAYLLHIGD